MYRRSKRKRAFRSKKKKLFFKRARLGRRVYGFYR